MSASIVVAHVFSRPPICLCSKRKSLSSPPSERLAAERFSLNGLYRFTTETEAANIVSPLVHNLCALRVECD